MDISELLTQWNFKQFGCIGTGKNTRYTKASAPDDR